MREVTLTLTLRVIATLRATAALATTAALHATPATTAAPGVEHRARQARRSTGGLALLVLALLRREHGSARTRVGPADRKKRKRA
jgi:hypothetical protein